MASALQIEDYTLILEYLEGENKLEDLLENSEELEKHILSYQLYRLATCIQIIHLCTITSCCNFIITSCCSFI